MNVETKTAVEIASGGEWLGPTVPAEHAPVEVGRFDDRPDDQQSDWGVTYSGEVTCACGKRFEAAGSAGAGPLTAAADLWLDHVSDETGQLLESCDELADEGTIRAGYRSVYIND